MDEQKPGRWACRRRSGRRALAAAAGRRRTGFHPLRAEAYRLRGGIRGWRPGRLFLGQTRCDRRSRFLEHDAEGGQTRPDANVTRANRLLWKGQVVTANLGKRSAATEPSFDA